MDTKITFVGTGSAFTKYNFQSNTIITVNNKNLLIDAGSDIRFSLDKLGMSYKNIDAVYITHLHADHIGGLEYLAFCNYFDPSMKEKPQLIGNNELVRELWNSSLKGGLKSIQGKKTNLDDYFDVMMIKKNGKFIWEGIEFHIVQSIHIMDEYSIVPSFGLMIHVPVGEEIKKIYYTGDTQFAPNQIMDFYKEANLIIHDCETSPFKSGVHANYLDLITLPSEIKAKMMLHHYQDNVISTDHKNSWIATAKEAGFTAWDKKNYGFIMCGSTFDLNTWEIDNGPIF